MHSIYFEFTKFQQATDRLKDGQAIAYLRLLFSYYDREGPLENNPKKLAFSIGADVDDVALILDRFFILSDDGMWHNERADKEIEAFYSRSVAARKKAEKRWGKGTEKNSNRNAAAMPQPCNSMELVLKSDAENAAAMPQHEKAMLPGNPVTHILDIPNGISCEPAENPSSSPKPDNVPYEAIRKLWNDSPCGEILGHATVLSARRKSAIRAIWKLHKDVRELAWWGRFFGEYLPKSDFLMGRSGKWSADFDWIINQNNFLKAREGRYENK